MSSARAILVGTDLTATSDAAILQAHRYCRERHDRLIVCLAVPNLLRMNMLFPQLNMEVEHVAEALDRAADAVRSRVVALTRLAPDAFEVVVEEGAAAEVLVHRAATTAGVELLVVGAASGTLRERLLGGVADHVIRHARIPVLVARPQREPGCVLVATSLTEASLPAVEAAAAEARWRRVPLHIVHSLDLVQSNIVSSSTHPFAPGSGVPLAPEQLDELRRRTGAEMKAALQRFAADGGEVHVLDGQAGESIVALADELRPELIVVGNSGRSGVRRLLLGSVAEYVIRWAERPTLVVRQAPTS